MERHHLDRIRLRSVALLAAACLVPAVAGCGGSEDAENGGAPSTDQRTGKTAGGSPGPAEAETGSQRRYSGPSLAGDRSQAKAGAVAVGKLYGDLEEAADAGIAAADVGVLNTLNNAARDESLGTVCSLMSEQAIRETVEYAKRSAGLAEVRWTCEKAMGLLLRRAREAGKLRDSLRAEVVGVNADGDRATATVRLGGKDGPLSSIPLVKEDGEWKLAASPGAGS